MSDLKPDPVDRALSLLYNASIVSPYLREAAETVTGEVERLRADLDAALNERDSRTRAWRTAHQEQNRLVVENGALKRDLAAARADYLEVAKALGITYEPDQGHVYAGELDAVLRAIQDAKRAVEERDEARAALSSVAEPARGLISEADDAARQNYHGWTEEEAQELEHLRAALAALAALPTTPEQEGTE